MRCALEEGSSARSNWWRRAAAAVAPAVVLLRRRASSSSSLSSILTSILVGFLLSIFVESVQCVKEEGGGRISLLHELDSLTLRSMIRHYRFGSDPILK